MLRKESKWRRPGRLVPLVIVALVVFGLVAFRLAAGSGIKGEVEAIRKRGLPMSARELDNWYPAVPASSNAALLFLDAAKEFVEPAARMNPNRMGRNLEPGEPMPPELKEAVALFVEDNELTLEKINAAAKLTASRYPINLSEGFSTLLPHLSRLKSMAQLSQWAAIQRSAEGKPDEAVRILLNGFSLAASLEQEPLMISELVRVACLLALLDGVERVVTEHKLTEHQLLALSEAMRRAEAHDKTAIRRALAGERAVGIEAFNMSIRELDRLGAGTGGSGGESLGELFRAVWYEVRRVTGLHAEDQAFYLEIMGQWEQAARKDYPEMLLDAKATASLMDSQLAKHRMKYTTSGMILPALVGLAEKEAIVVARLRCARMALAIERCRLKNNGKLPALNELSPRFLDAIPRDPIDGQPLEYLVTGDTGYEILAAAANEKAYARRGKNSQEVKFTVAR